MLWIRKIFHWGFLVVQWLGLGVFTAMAQIQPLVGELRFHKPCGEKKTQKMSVKHHLRQHCPTEHPVMEMEMCSVCVVWYSSHYTHVWLLSTWNVLRIEFYFECNELKSK